MPDSQEVPKKHDVEVSNIKEESLPLSSVPLEVNGAELEGGGQLVRMTVGLAAILQRKLRIVNVRGKRTRPGLRAQHVAGVRLIAELCGPLPSSDSLAVKESLSKETQGKTDVGTAAATGDAGASKRGRLDLGEKRKSDVKKEEGVETSKDWSVVDPNGRRLVGDEVGKGVLHFDGTGVVFPAKTDYFVDVKTAGSLTLLIQAVLPVLVVSAPIDGEFLLNFRGGTNVSMSPHIDYVYHVFRQVVAKPMGIQMNIAVKTRGFFPRGGGEIFLQVRPSLHIKPLMLTQRGKITKIRAHVYWSGSLPEHIPQRMMGTIKQTMRKSLYKSVPIEYRVEKGNPMNSVGNSCFVRMDAFTSTGCILEGSAIGERGKKAEVVALEACENLIQDLSKGGCVDCHLQDQCIVFMALAKGRSIIKCGPLELHTQTAIHFASMMTGATFHVYDQLPSSLEEYSPKESTDILGITHWIVAEGVGFSNTMKFDASLNKVAEEAAASNEWNIPKGFAVPESWAVSADEYPFQSSAEQVLDARKKSTHHRHHRKNGKRAKNNSDFQRRR